MGGAYVFPGGKLDGADQAPELRPHLAGRTAEGCARALAESEDPDRALGLFVAAARETFEEAGVLLGKLDGGGSPDPERLGEARRRLIEGAPFARILQERGALLRLDWLVAQARWITPQAEPKRFDTRFFLARVPEGQTPDFDRQETTDAAWMSPVQALERQRSGQIQLPPPTLRTLELLSEHHSSEHALQAVASRPPPRVCPVLLQDEERVTLCLPGDAEHPDPNPALPGPTRLVLEGGRWWARAAGPKTR
jgi:8-oxo-dGTP pyrophosphatase MutT (NUDIX family)